MDNQMTKAKLLDNLRSNRLKIGSPLIPNESVIRIVLRD